jgi:hypothetical protein
MFVRKLTPPSEHVFCLVYPLAVVNLAGHSSNLWACRIRTCNYCLP